MKKSKVKSKKAKGTRRKAKSSTLKTKKVVRKPVKAKSKKITKRRKRISIPTTIHFEASEFPYYSKNREWILAIILFGTIVGVLAWWYKMWLMLVVIALALFVMFQNANKRPKKLSGHINDTQVQFGKLIYPLVNYRSFWIVPDKNESQLYLRPIKKFTNSTHIQIPNDRAIEIHQKLLSILPEEQSMGDAIVSKINHWFRF